MKHLRIMFTTHTVIIIVYLSEKERYFGGITAITWEHELQKMVQ